MSEEKITPESFDERKYDEDFPKVQSAYKRAFDEMNDSHDSELVHAIDQQVLSESEPFYEGDGEFRVELPADPVARVEGVVASDSKVERTLDRYVSVLEKYLAAAFGVEGSGGG